MCQAGHHARSLGQIHHLSPLQRCYCCHSTYNGLRAATGNGHVTKKKKKSLFASMGATGRKMEVRGLINAISVRGSLEEGEPG
jgi:hypothetical protein